MFRHRLNAALVIARDHDDLPNGQGAALDAGKAPDWRIAEIDEGELGTSQAFFNKAGRSVANRPAMMAGHFLKSFAAGPRQPHADHGCLFFTHVTIVSFVIIVIKLKLAGHRDVVIPLPGGARLLRSSFRDGG